jgi:hypothetical protein
MISQILLTYVFVMTWKEVIYSSSSLDYKILWGLVVGSL